MSRDLSLFKLHSISFNGLELFSFYVSARIKCSRDTNTGDMMFFAFAMKPCKRAMITLTDGDDYLWIVFEPPFIRMGYK